ncbi:class I SAM-dependent methyltransferase [Verrucomicrobium spinosum]|uniref:class I SAM-dependent methyltransferase n=2 Tax=Verrucomicrobium spinosum TaxID=2736 RepID=UPI0009EABBFA|nr:class I SAM-dependent methyltransferase [Verrucomicrobium spinosum]
MSPVTRSMANAQRPHSTPLPTAVRWVHAILEPRLLPGDLVVDATAGNGHDTLFLAQRVLPEGQVFAFDIQADAIQQTEIRLREAGVDMSRITLHVAGHETLSAALPTGVHQRLRLCMFNLGYLPGGDKARITQVETTLSAIQQAMDLLEEDGLLTVVVYPGHDGGMQEAGRVTAMLEAASPDTWEVQRIGYLNFRPTTPFCLVARRRTAARPT